MTQTAPSGSLRFARPADADSLLEIYSQYLGTPVTFECELPTRAEFERRITETTALYPYLVFEAGGRPLGYAYAHRFQSRAAYGWGAELSVYVARGAVSQGIGRRLYTALLRLLEIQGVRIAYACVTLPNEKSERLHAEFGFERLCVMKNAGYKLGAWHDVAWFEKPLACCGPAPEPIIPVGGLDGEKVSEILLDAAK